jgi:hypothetical protein
VHDLTCLNEVLISMFVDLHASAINLPTETRKKIWLRCLVVTAEDQIPSQISPRGDIYWKSDAGTHWHIGFFSQTGPWWIFIGPTGIGAADSIQTSPYEVCIENTGTRTSDSILDQSMWDVRRTKWH